MAPSLNPPVRFPNPHAGRTLFARWWPGVRPFSCSPIRVAGMLPVILVLGLHALAYLTAVPAALVPLLPRFPLSAMVLLLLFHFCFLSALANYLLLVYADPGSPPDDWKAPAPVVAIRSPSPSSCPSPSSANSSLATSPAGSDACEHIDADYPLPPVKNGHYMRKFKHAHLMHERTTDGYLRYCEACRAYKPDRSHHCSVCRRCVLRMDHHCVFVNNCVSFYNHKFFVSFVFFAFLGCAITALVAFPTFADIVAVVPSRPLGTAPRAPHAPIVPAQPAGAPAVFAGTNDRLAVAAPQTARPAQKRRQALSDLAVRVRRGSRGARTISERTLSLGAFSAARSLSTPLKTVAMVGYITSTAFAFALGVFVSLHVFLVSKGRTTIEMYEMADPVRAQRVADYDLGCARNFRNVFGPVVACWPLPTRAYIPGDGLSFDRRSDALLGEGAV